MVQILPAAEREPSFSEVFAKKLGGSFGQKISEVPAKLIGQRQMESENKALKNLGIDLSGITDPQTRQLVLSEKLKEGRPNSLQGKEKEKINNLNSLKYTIDEMRSLVNKSGIGLSGLFQLGSDKARYNRSRMQTLNSDLLNFYKSTFPRGLTQEEFKKLEKKYLITTFDTKADMEGKIDAFEDLINRKLQSYDKEELSEEESSLVPKEKKKFNLSNKEHLKKFNQLDKKFNGDQQKINEALAREFYL